MNTTKQKLTLSQETLRILTQNQPSTAPTYVGSTFPTCPTCSLALQTRAEMQ